MLGRQIRKLNHVYMRGIIKIVTKGKPVKEEALEFDINKLSPRTNHSLKKYVEDCGNGGAVPQIGETN